MFGCLFINETKTEILKLLERSGRENVKLVKAPEKPTI